MKKIWNILREHWMRLIHPVYHIERSEWTKEEFKKLWNDQIEEMKID